MVYRCYITPRVLCGPCALPGVSNDKILSIPSPPAAAANLGRRSIPSRLGGGGDVEIRIWDSTSEMRYFVLPEAPTDFQNKSLDELESMVTRNSMIGVEKIKDPEKQS